MQHDPLSSRPMINGLIFPNQTLEFKFRWVNAKVNIVISSFDLYRISGVIHNKSETRQFAALYVWLAIKILRIRAFMYLGKALLVQSWWGLQAWGTIAAEKAQRPDFMTALQFIYICVYVKAKWIYISAYCIFELLSTFRRIIWFWVFMFSKNCLE